MVKLSAPVACFATFTLGLALMSCGSEGSRCSSHDDCAGSLYCSGPNDPNVCGIPGMEFCADDQGCDPSSRCFAQPDPCSPDGIGSECRLPCEEGGCYPGFRCNAAGACEPTPCDEGFACEPYQVCDPELAHSDAPMYNRTQGCVAITCQGDGDCPGDTACVNGSCHSGPGTCREVQIVP